MHGPDYVFITLSIFFFLHKNIVQSSKMKKPSIKGKLRERWGTCAWMCCSRLLAGPNEFGLASSSRERNAAARRRTSQKREREKDVYVDYMGLQWRQTNWEADQSASGKRRKRERDENQLPYTPRPPKAPAPLLHLLLLLPPSLIFFFFFSFSLIYIICTSQDT